MNEGRSDTVYTKTTRFRHDSIPNSITAVADLGNTTSPGWDTIATEDEKLAFGSRSALYQFDALIFISTTGDVLSPDGIELMRQYLRDGGSFVGIHSSSDCLRSTPWFGRTLGAYFRVHPEVTNATLQVADSKHPSVSFLKNGTWAVYDEIYTFNVSVISYKSSDPRLLNHTVLLTVEDGTYADAATSEGLRAQLMGQPHPLAWCKDGSKPGNGLMDPPSRPVGGGVDDSRDSAQPSGQGGPGRSWYTS
ncbi:hypothetical protein OC845_005906 [Tilletia horrida]|nr:hypothetical protein OC845_005906 [Tilletia horrida]